ncbi:uncharacterized protein LOC113327811 [Papaver somniferum]|uniref:uncharacterized protein LOC113327811 n=1 Tax=Papaver somniferum TaxID=3469 RepID=UPI000E6F951A|nr:uncharacterized protein LOC113327811 [Papaver somniferum]
MAPRSKTSLPEQNGTLQHITHPHVLIKQTFEDIQNEGYENDEFVCDGCRIEGSGARYHCKQCSFDLHEDCATCPGFLTSSIHPNHPLELIWEGAENDHGQLRPCDVCGNQVQGLFYKCSSGAPEKRYDDGNHYFFIHPTCSKFQPQLHHPTDENHPLRLQPVPVIPDGNMNSQCVTLPYNNYQQVIPDGNINPQCAALPYNNYHGNINPQSVTLPYNDYQQVRPSPLSQQQEARSSQRQVDDAGRDADALAPAKFAAKMAAKAGKFILSQRQESSSSRRQVAGTEKDSDALAAAKYAAKMAFKAGKYVLSQRQAADGKTDSDSSASAKYAAEMAAKAGKYVMSQQQEARPLQRQEARPSQRQQIDDAEADGDALAAAMYEAKMRAKTNKFIIKNLI